MKMYSDAIKLHEMMNIRPMIGSFNTNGMLYLMRGNLKKRKERIWIRVDRKKEFDWTINPDECRIFMYIREEKPVVLMEQPVLTKREDGNWFFDAVAWLAEKKIGYEYHMPWKKAARESWSLEGGFWAGKLGMTKIDRWDEKYGNVERVKATAEIPQGMAVCGRETGKVEVNLFADKSVWGGPEASSLMQKMMDAPTTPQNISAQDLRDFIRWNVAVCDVDLTGTAGKHVSMFSTSYVHVKWRGIRWTLDTGNRKYVMERENIKLAEMELLLKLWEAESLDEINELMKEAVSVGLGNMVVPPVLKVLEPAAECEAGKTTKAETSANPYETYDKFVLIHVMTLEGGGYFCLLADSHDPLARGARIVFREGKKEKQMQHLINPKCCKWYFSQNDGSGQYICEDLKEEYLEDGNLLIDPGKWLDEHGIQWKLRPYKECAGYWSNTMRCWNWYRYW